MKPVLIIQNDAKEGAGQLATLIAERGLGQETVFGYDTDYGKLASDDYSALVVLGGGQSAYETEAYPYLTDEIALCHDFMQAGKPIAGFCLGAQILARALGGEVSPGATKEIGWYDLVLSEAAAWTVRRRSPSPSPMPWTPSRSAIWKCLPRIPPTAKASRRAARSCRWC